jgi:hypothetical protein
MNAANGYHLLITPGTSSTLSGTYVIKNVNSGLALDTSGGRTAQGTAVVQAAPSGSGTQNWTLVPEDTSYYEIKNTASGLLLVRVDRPRIESVPSTRRASIRRAFASRAKEQDSRRHYGFRQIKTSWPRFLCARVRVVTMIESIRI